VSVLRYSRDSAIRFCYFRFFDESSSPGPQIIDERHFNFFYTSGKLITGVVDTGGKFTIGIDDTGRKFPLMSVTPTVYKIAYT
jgi:hypothetical protein